MYLHIPFEIDWEYHPPSKKFKKEIGDKVKEVETKKIFCPYCRSTNFYIIYATCLKCFDCKGYAHNYL